MQKHGGNMKHLCFSVRMRWGETLRWLFSFPGHINWCCFLHQCQMSPWSLVLWETKPKWKSFRLIWFSGSVTHPWRRTQNYFFSPVGVLFTRLAGIYSVSSGNSFRMKSSENKLSFYWTDFHSSFWVKSKGNVAFPCSGELAEKQDSRIRKTQGDFISTSSLSSCVPLKEQGHEIPSSPLPASTRWREDRLGQTTNKQRLLCAQEYRRWDPSLCERPIQV